MARSYFLYNPFRKRRLLFYLLFIACSKDPSPLPEPEPKPPSRTILYYLAADNSLYDEANDKVEALRAGFPDGENRLVIYKDTRNHTPELLEIYRDDQNQSQVRTVKTYPEQNSASGETLEQVLDDVQERFPADSYGLILFSHASGWLPRGTLVRPDLALLQMGIHPAIRTYTLAMDGTDELNLTEFATAIPDHFFDFIAFEACFMTGIEVLYELKDKTDCIIASSAEMLSPGFLPMYPGALSLLYRPQADAVGFAQQYFNFWNGLSGDYRSATISVIQTKDLPLLADWAAQHVPDAVEGEDLPAFQHFDRYSSHRLFFDFADYYGRNVSGEDREQLTALLDRVVVYRAATPTFIPSQRGFEIRQHSGITTYIPQERFVSLNKRYADLAWTQRILIPKP